jgi:TolB-like protein
MTPQTPFTAKLFSRPACGARLAALFAMLVIGTAGLAAQPKVLLLPFDSIGPAERQWVAKAVQQNLLAELSRINSVQPLVADKIARDQTDALKLAADANADYVVFGSYQSVEGDLRITGQVIDVARKQAVAGLKTTGTQRDLFGMEDVIANQVKRALPQPVAQAQPEMLQQPPAAPPAVEATGPVVMDVNQKMRDLEDQIDRMIDRMRYAPAYDDYYPNYYSGYSYPYYPTYYYPVFINRGGHHHHQFPHPRGISGSYVGSRGSVSFVLR